MALTKITSDVIETGAVTSDHLASGAVTHSSLSSITTDNVSEGSTNTYFTNARARGSVSVTGGGLSYDSSTGVIQIGSIPNASLTNSSLTVNSNSVSLGGSVTLDTDDIGEGSTNLYFTNARAQGAISGGTGVTVSSGTISIGQDVATSSTPTFGNITTTGYIAGPATFTIDPAAVGDNTGTVVIAGNLQVDGTTTTINSTTMTVDDLNITLASGAANAAAANGAGITVDGASATITYDGTNDEWDFNKDINVTGTITASGNITGTLATAAQTNITSVGTLTSLNTSGSVTMNKSVASSDFLGNANVYPLRLTNDDTTAGNAVALTFGQGGFDFTNFIASVRTGTGDNPKGDLVFGGRPSDGSAFLERMRILANGHVGIGQTAPAYLLEVGDDGATAGNVRIAGGGDLRISSATGTTAAGGDTVLYSDANDLTFSLGTSSSAKARFASDGQLLIGGTTSDVGASTNILEATGNARFKGGNRSIKFNNGSHEITGIQQIASHKMQLGSQKVTIDVGNSRLGVNEISPAQTLHVNSGSNATIMRLERNGVANYDFTVTDGGAGAAQLYFQAITNDTGFNFQTRNSSGTTTNALFIDPDGLITLDANRSEWGMRLRSNATRAGIVLDKPGTTTIMGSMLMLESDESFRLGTASNYHIKMLQNGTTVFGNTTNYSKFDVSGHLQVEHGGEIKFEAGTNDYSTIYTSAGYASQSYSTSARYWNHLISKGGTHITVNSDGGHTNSENTYDDFVVWQGSQDTAEPLFRVSNTGRVIAKQNYEIGNHKTNKEEFGVNAINTVDTATSDVNTTVTNTYENRSGVYWLNFNSKRFRAFVRPQWMQGRNWILAAKFFAFNDMPSGSALWTNDASWNGGDFDLNNGQFSKYGNVWRYFGFSRLAMQMGDRVAPIMQFSSTQTLYGAFSGGRAANGGGVSPTSTDPALSTGAIYHTMTNYMGPAFTDVGGLEDKLQSYGLNKWANNATNSTSANNQGSYNNTAVVKGHQLTVEDSHPNVSGNDSVGFAGAWIGCPLDEGNCNPLSASSNGGADSGFGFGGGCGNNARTWTSGIAEWARGNEVANYLPAYIWLSID